MSTIVNIRIDEAIKKQATRKLKSLGLDLSSAIKLFLHQVITENGLPFTPTNNMERIREKWDQESKEALKSRHYSSAKDALKDL